MKNIKSYYSAIFPILCFCVFLIIYTKPTEYPFDNVRIIADPTNNESLSIQLKIKNLKSISDGNYNLVFLKKGTKQIDNQKNEDLWYLYKDNKSTLYFPFHTGKNHLITKEFEVKIKGNANHYDSFVLEPYSEIEENLSQKNKGKIQLSNNSKVFLIFFLTLLLLAIDKPKKIIKLMPILAFVFLCFITASYSDEKLLSLKRTIMVFFPFIVIMNHYTCCENIDKVLIKFGYFFLIFSTLLCFFSLFLYLLDDSISIYTRSFNGISFFKNDIFPIGQFYSSRPITENLTLMRPSSLFSNTIGFSHIILISYFFSLHKLILNKKLIYLFLTIFFIFFIFWTNSRVSILSLIIFTPFLLLRDYINIKFIGFILLVITLIYLPLLLFIYDVFDLSFLPRMKLYKSILIFWNDFWLFGSGGFGVVRETFLENNMDSLINYNIDNIQSLKPTIQNSDIVFHPSVKAEIEEFKNLSIPSVPLTILIELGSVGLLLFLIIFFKPFVQTDRNNTSFIFVIILTSIFFTQLFDISLFRFHPLSFFIAFILGSLNNERLK